MDIVQLLILAALGVMGGVLSGLVDGGGGIIFVPALVYAAGWDIKEAVAASCGGRDLRFSLRHAA